MEGISVTTQPNNTPVTRMEKHKYVVGNPREMHCGLQWRSFYDKDLEFLFVKWPRWSSTDHGVGLPGEAGRDGRQAVEGEAVDLEQLVEARRVAARARVREEERREELERAAEEGEEPLREGADGGRVGGRRRLLLMSCARSYCLRLGTVKHAQQPCIAGKPACKFKKKSNTTDSCKTYNGHALIDRPA